MQYLWRCVNCRKAHSTLRIFSILKGEFYSTDFCSDKCLQQYHKTHDIGLLETAHSKKKSPDGYPLYTSVDGKMSLTGHMDNIIMWIRPKMKIVLTLSENANWWYRLTKFESRTDVEGVPVPIYKYEIKE